MTGRCTLADDSFSKRQRAGFAVLTRDQVGGVLRELGFNETQAAGLFFWFEYPSPSWERNQDERQIVARVQFYEARSDLDAWLFRPFRPHETYAAKHSGYVHTEEEVRAAGVHMLGERLAVIARASGARPPPELISAIDDETGLRVLQDWMMERGIDPR